MNLCSFVDVFVSQSWRNLIRSISRHSLAGALVSSERSKSNKLDNPVVHLQKLGPPRLLESFMSCSIPEGWLVEFHRIRFAHFSHS